MNNQIVVLGPIAYDDIETPYGKVNRVLGGCGCYISLVCANFEVKCSLVSIAGRDFAEEDYLLLKEKNIDLDGLEIDQNGNTLYWSGFYDYEKNIRITRTTEIGVFENFNPNLSDRLLHPSILLLGNIHPQVQLNTLRQFERTPLFIALDTMNYWIKNELKLLLEVIKKVDLICINNEEALSLTGEKSIIMAGETLQKMGPRHVIIKLGEFGAYLFSSKERFFTPAYPIATPKDPTGAGDCFLGGFISYIVQNQKFGFNTMKKAMQYGTASASLVVEDFGVRRIRNISFEVIQDRVNQLRELTKWKGNNLIYNRR